MLDGVLFLLGIDIQLINCFWKIRVALRRASLVQLVRANPVLVEVERVKMAVVC